MRRYIIALLSFSGYFCTPVSVFLWKWSEAYVYCQLINGGSLYRQEFSITLKFRISRFILSTNYRSHYWKISFALNSMISHTCFCVPIIFYAIPVVFRMFTAELLTCIGCLFEFVKYHCFPYLNRHKFTQFKDGTDFIMCFIEFVGNVIACFS